MIKLVNIFNAKILIVDDQQPNIDLLQQMLSEAGYTDISTTKNPEEVCALHRKNKYDIILLDLQMPVMDGFQVMEGLKTNHRDPYLPVMVLTAQPGHKIQALQAGARDFISKPFDLIEVKTRINNMAEVRLLYNKLENYNKLLEQEVLDRTAELRVSEARFRSLTELACDWYWEQDETMKFTKVSGPVLDLLGFQLEPLSEEIHDTPLNGVRLLGLNEEERSAIKEKIINREPFIDFIFSRDTGNGVMQKYQISGEPMFDSNGRYKGYRGVGFELTRS